MNNKKYRVVCLLNALERRLFELRAKKLRPEFIAETIRNEGLRIMAETSRSDLRYFRDRMEYVLGTHCAGADMEKFRAGLRCSLGLGTDIEGTALLRSKQDDAQPVAHA